MSASLPLSGLPDGIVDYPARDMTITVGAGMKIGQLQSILKKEQQQLPIDVHDDGLSLSDCVAFDLQGSRQFGYGTLRDYVIGVEAIDGNGRVFHAGGRVVKNVAGYDLCRLLTGSRHLLGQIRQLTFKLKPLPEQRRLFIAGFRTLQDLEPALDRLNLTQSTPTIMDAPHISVFATIASAVS
jgi:glycolate oxidase FAD binding subunit